MNKEIAKYEKFADKVTDGKFHTWNANEKIRYILGVEEGFGGFGYGKDMKWIAKHFDDIECHKQHPLYYYIKSLFIDVVLAR